MLLASIGKASTPELAWASQSRANLMLCSPMPFTIKQQGVLAGMILGGSISLALILTGCLFNPFAFGPALPVLARVEVLFDSMLPVGLLLVFAIGRQAKHRFQSADIDGGGLHQDLQKTIFLQSLLQNTLEQTVVAAVVYGAWAIVMPSSWLSVVPLASTSFCAGRVLFFARYQKGAPGRALGFALTFYPSVFMLLFLITHQLIS